MEKCARSGHIDGDVERVLVLHMHIRGSHLYQMDPTLRLALSRISALTLISPPWFTIRIHRLEASIIIFVVKHARAVLIALVGLGGTSGGYPSSSCS